MPDQSHAPSIATVRDLHCVLARGTTVLHASPGILRLTGHELHSFVGLPLCHLVHPDDCSIFLNELDHAALSPGRVFRFYSRIRTAFQSPAYAAFELQGHFHQLHPPVAALGRFVLVARPAFLSSSMQIDRFLELKIEEISLQRHLDGLRQAEDDDDEDTDLAVVAPSSSVVPDAQPLALLSGFAASAQNAMMGPSATNTTPRNHARPHALVDGDVGIPYTLRSPDSAARKAANEKRNSQKSPVGHVCTWCGTTEAPEWRRGPSGAKTLCNACGCMFPDLFFSCMLIFKSIVCATMRACSFCYWVSFCALKPLNSKVQVKKCFLPV
ncbi:White collar 2 protein [Diplodia seriata]|uniref:White collar 2 protein n=1 Tax=Diplodia seriata TaxID=420778 RepID=A0A1S8BL56_9PEZI|nr:White collar 2 protein [Diplodia seriata]